MDYKNHPAFLAFKASNVKEKVDYEDKVDKDIVESDNKGDGGEGGKD